MNEVYQEVVLGKPIEDEWRKALKYVSNWTIANKGLSIIDFTSLENTDGYEENTRVYHETSAWITPHHPKETIASDRICFVPAKLKEILKSGGFGPEKTIEAWAENSIIDFTTRKDKKTGKTYGKPITELNKTLSDGSQVTVIKLIRDTVETTLGFYKKDTIEELKDSIKKHRADRYENGIETDTQITLAQSFARGNTEHTMFELSETIVNMAKNDEIAGISLI